MSSTLTYQLKWIWSVLTGYRLQLLMYFILELVSICLTLLFIYWSKSSIDIAMKVAEGDLNRVIMLLVGTLSLGLIVSSSSFYINENIRIKFGVNLQKNLIKAQMLSLWQGIKDWHSGDIQTRIHSDSTEVINMIVSAGLVSILTFIRLIASFSFLWLMDAKLALIILGLSPLILISKLFFKKMKTLNIAIKKGESAFAEVLQENLRLRFLIRGMNLFSSRWNKLVDSQQNLLERRLQQLKFSLFTQSIMKLSLQIGYLTTFIWGLYSLQSGIISFGTMAAFLQLISRIQGPIIQLISFIPVFIRFRTSLDRVIELAQVESEEIHHNIKLNGLTAITLDNIHFQYQDQTVIANFSAQFQINKPTAIVGSSGKGKTTLIRILLSLIKTESGKLRFINQGVEIPITREYRTNFIYVPQGNTLFAGTIRENLLTANPAANQETLQRALYTACAEFVYDLPKGLDTLIGESAYGISEGQAQRIGIARALLNDVPIWLFDEITSALDEETANQLVNRLLLVSKNKIVIFITHDMQVSTQCSQTIYLK